MRMLASNLKSKYSQFEGNWQSPLTLQLLEVVY